ncbi:alpha/beta hydrolase family protein [Simiduia aestuariiviva]|uniref:Dienelactone hydrolase n=1 Tax=Simiduia aestuariiviva TaxID=1510459 RepID=A0A839UI90_9GAMM|nr:alpha/beta fold hydrolase [Simiduia aestuariiviva]MBB3167774.1 dienelactone hydrolase [Simiduia aestuariiviva]
MSLSPNGKYIVARMRYDDRVAAIFVERETGKIIGGLKPTLGSEIHRIIWVNNEQVTYQIAERVSYLDAPIPTGEIFTASYTGQGAKLLAGYRAGDLTTGTFIKGRQYDKSTFRMLHSLPDDSNRILVVEYPWTLEGNTWYDTRKRFPIVSRLDVRSGKKTRSETLPFRDPQLLVDANGVLTFAIWEDEAGDEQVSFRESAESDWEVLKGDGISIGSGFVALKIDNLGEKAYFMGAFGEAGYRTIFELDIQSKVLAPMFTDLDADISDWEFDPDTGRVVAGVSFKKKARYHFANTDSSFLKAYKRLSRAFKGQNISVVSRTHDNSHYLIRVTSDVNPGEYYAFNRTNNKADFVWANSSWIDPREMLPMLSEAIEVSDGVEVPVRLTLPEQSENAPVVLVVHGGPHGVSDHWGFDPEVQLLANRGYAVIQVNFRGSDGFGANFARAGYGEWGGKIIDDIYQASGEIINKYKLNRKSVCSYGASFGGYASLMLAARYPDFLKCAVGYVGIYDLNLMYTSGDIPIRWGGVSYLEMVLGRDAKQLAEYSPINYAKDIKAQVMLIHGAKDNRAPLEHAEAMKEALENVGNKPEWLIYGRSGHGVRNLDDRRELYTEMLNFFQKNLVVSES